LRAKICIEAIKISGYLDKDIASMLDIPKFNRAMTGSHIWGMGSAIKFFNGSNITGIWHVACERKYYYMISTPGKQIPYPKKHWKCLG